MTQYRGFQIAVNYDMEYDYSLDGKTCVGTEWTLEEAKQAIDQWHLDQMRTVHINQNKYTFKSIVDAMLFASYWNVPFDYFKSI